MGLQEYFIDPADYVGRSYHLVAPAKLNLRLKVEGRRADGFHLLSMLNVLTAYHDEVKVTFCAEPGVALEVFSDCTQCDPGVSSVEKNIAAVAARLFLDKFQIPLGVRLSLKKNIPLGSGLGGGSSDAGAVLRFFLRCFTERIVQEGIVAREALLGEVIKLAVGIGADVPFFVRGSFARVTGVGDLIERYDARFLSDVRCLIIVPPVSNSTKEVYNAFRAKSPIVERKRDLAGEQYGETLRLNTAVEGYEPFPSRTIRASLWRQLLAQVQNDLESVVCEFSPLVGQTLAELRKVPEVVSSITGSGSAIFVLPKTLDYFDKNGTGIMREVLAGRGLCFVETELVPFAAFASF